MIAKTHYLNAMSNLRNLYKLKLDETESGNKVTLLKKTFISEVEKMFEGFEEFEDRRLTADYLSNYGKIYLEPDNFNNYEMAEIYLKCILRHLDKNEICKARVSQYMAIEHMKSLAYNKNKQIIQSSDDFLNMESLWTLDRL